jgi:hypothetical protein
MAIQATTIPIPSLGSLGVIDLDDVANKSYYWSRVYAQACLGKVLIKAGQEKDGNLILSSVRETLARESKAKSRLCDFNGDIVSFVLLNEDRCKAYVALGSSKTEE